MNSAETTLRSGCEIGRIARNRGYGKINRMSMNCPKYAIACGARQDEASRGCVTVVAKFSVQLLGLCLTMLTLHTTIFALAYSASNSFSAK